MGVFAWGQFYDGKSPKPVTAKTPTSLEVLKDDQVVQVRHKKEREREREERERRVRDKEKERRKNECLRTQETDGEKRSKQ